MYEGKEEYKGTFTRIIDKPLFDKCQPGYKEPTAHAAPRSANNPVYSLRGLFYCTECGNPITGSSPRARNGKHHQYYHHGTKKTCKLSQFIPKLDFEKQFVQFLETITPDGKYEKLFKAVVIEIWQRNYKQLDAQNATIRKEIEQLELERQQVFQLHRSGKYSDEEFLEQKRLVNLRITKNGYLFRISLWKN